MNRTILILSILFVAVAPPHLFATDKKQEINYIRNLYSDINTSIKNNKSDLVLYHTGKTDYGPYNNKSIKWKKVQPGGSAVKFKDSDYKARVYYIGGIIRKVIFYNVGEGWNTHEEYYFYKKGSTAFVFEKLDTLQGYDINERKPLESPPFIVEKRTYYFEGGTIIRKLEKAFRKKDGVKIPLQFIRRSVMANTYFCCVKDLPFMKGNRVRSLIYDSNSKEIQRK